MTAVRTLLLCVMLMLAREVVRSQSSDAKSGDLRAMRRAVQDPEPARTADPSVPFKRPWLAAAEVIGSNAVAWSYFRFINGDHWARIDIHSIRNNLRRGFWWDEDGFMGNQFNHPYHGSSYYTAGRVNGLSFWESAPYALAGSAIWEVFLETEQPSYNDIVTTPVSGIIFGEISYRVTDLILDESDVGVSRVIRESSAFLLNPMRGFNRIIRGEMWGLGPAPSRADHSMWLSVGGLNVFKQRSLARNHGYASIRFAMEYGDRMRTVDHRDPFDAFSLAVDMNMSPSDNIFAITAGGVLWDGTVSLSERSKSVIGLYKEFDLLNNLVYHMTATSVTGRLTHVVPHTVGLRGEYSFGASAILMGGVNSQNAMLYGKQYNIGPGASARIDGRLNLNDRGDVHVSYKRTWIHTLNGAQSEEYMGLLNVGVEAMVVSGVAVVLEALFYDRTGAYSGLQELTDANSAVKLGVKAELN